MVSKFRSYSVSLERFWLLVYNALKSLRPAATGAKNVYT